jgi:tetratricopeptide (TPR) repeat protein
MSLKHSYLKWLLVSCLLLLLTWTSPLTRGQDNPAGTINLAQIEKSIEQGRVEEIEKPLLDYAVLHPKDVRALYLLGQVRYLQGRLEEAKALYQRVLVLNPSLAKAKIILGQIMYESGQQDEGRQLIVGVAQSPPTNPFDQLALGNALVLVGEYQRALAAAEKLPVVVKNVEALPVMAASYLALGDRQRLTALIPLMKRAAVSKPAVAVQCAEILQKAAMTRYAIELLRSVLAANPDKVNVLVLLGRLETEARDFVQARRHLNRAASLKPRSADLLSAQAQLESAQGDLTAALDSLNHARSLAPDSLPILAQFVVTAMRANQVQAAVEAADKLVKLKPDEPEFTYLFGAALLQNGSLGPAQKALERYVRQRPDDSRGCLALGITFALEHDQPEAAQAQFERCLQLDPTNVEAKYQLGLLFKAQGEMTKAVQLLEEVTTRAPQHANALRDLGTLYMQTGDVQKARAVLERAVAMSPQDAETHFQLSRLYNRIGESALAERHLEIFQKLKSQREKGSAP